MMDQPLNTSTANKRQTQEVSELDELRVSSGATSKQNIPSEDVLTQASLSSANVERKSIDTPDKTLRSERATTPTLGTEIKSTQQQKTSARASEAHNTVTPAPVYSGTIIDRLITFVAYLLKKLELALLNFLENPPWKKQKVVRVAKTEHPKSHTIKQKKPKKDEELDAAVIIKRE